MSLPQETPKTVRFPLPAHRPPFSPHTQRKGHEKTQREASHLQARERGLTRNQPRQHPELGLLA